MSADLPSRVPPQNLDAERGLLGSILLENHAIDEVADVILGEHFYLDAHQKIYRAIHSMYEAGIRGIDAVTLAESLDKRGELEEVGGVRYLLEVLHSVPHAAHAKYYAGIVRDKWMLRSLIYACTDILKSSYEESDDTQELLAKAERSVFQILEQQATGGKLELREILLDTFDRINDRMANPGAINGLTTGFVDLDTQTNGLQPSELIILAARPSMGKTAFVVNVAEAAAELSHAGVVIFSLEQSKLELAERFLCVRAKLQVHKIRKGDLSDNDRDLLLQVSHELSELPLFIDDMPGRSMAEISAICRRLKRRHKLGLIVIDYLQLIEPEDRKAPREQQIAGITRRLKFLAKELHVPVIALAQLNRGVELREDKRPRLADLRESGAIEQDADLVVFLHRPEMYDPEDNPGLAEIIVAKHRSGPTGIIKLTFSKESMRFQNYSPLADMDREYFPANADLGSF